MSLLADTVGKLRWDITHRYDVHNFRTTTLGDSIADRIQSALLQVSYNPTNKIAWNALSILAFADGVHPTPNSHLFYSDDDVQELIKRIEDYPQVYGASTLDRYWNEYIACHENPKLKWGVSSIISEIFSGEVLHEWPITIGKVRIKDQTYLFVGHDKNHNQWRARTEDHRAVIDILQQNNHSEYDGVVFFVDTPGADSGRQANESHQAATMSELITTVATLNKPTITLLTGEGGSGGAEVFFGSDLRIALENSYFSTIHPFGQAAIGKWRHSPKEIVWMLGVDAPHLYKRGVIDNISHLSLQREGSSPSNIQEQLSEVLASGFALIQEKIKWGWNTSEQERRLLFRWLRLRGQTANMLNPRNREIAQMHHTISGFPKYHEHDIKANFDAFVKWDTDTHTRILDFFAREFESLNLTKFNILSAIDTLIEHVGSKKYTSQLDPKKRNEIVGTMREELYHYQAFFSILSVLIDPKNYDKFFSTSGTHADRMVAQNWEGLVYEKVQIEKFLREIFDSIDPRHTHTSYETWKQSHFSWMSTAFRDQKDTIIELVKKFKQVHYDLPDTIVALALLLEQKFIEAISDEEYNPTLVSSDTLTIDFHTKAVYEQIRFYEWLRSQIFAKRWVDEIQRKFISFFKPLYPNFDRVHTTALQNTKKLNEKPQSAARVGWGQIGYDFEQWDIVERREMNQLFWVIMLDFSIEWGAIDGSAAANIIRLIEQAVREERPIVMFLQSAGMYVDGGPEAVSSMTAINFAIAEYFRKTAGNPKCQIFSVPFWVCTGGTIASFAQAPGVKILPLSLSDIPFAGRIVTMDQLPLSATLADLQVGKWSVAGIVSNPFISEDTTTAIYEALRSRGIAVDIPDKDLLSYIAEYLNIPIDNTAPIIETNGVKEQTNAELFHPYNKVAVLNRWVIAAKAMEVLHGMKKPYLALATAADKDLSYIKRAAKKWNVTFVHDYMMSELAIIQAIKDGGCDAVYLGYGFWSERDSFIQMCQKYGIVVIGPNAANVKQMWDKIEARKTFKKVLEMIEPSEEERIKYAPARGSDDVIGGDGIILNTDIAISTANNIGYPVMIKAVYGGGGKWIRKVYSDDDLRTSFDLMSREATESFGNGSMYMEKAVENQRHIEVQVFADIHGNAISLWVRDCTTQRSKQKIIEETGDLGIKTQLLNRLQGIAVAVAQNIGYVGAGTFEFLYDPVKEIFTFMEMNTRIQVEHTITERYLNDTMKQGINLVELQFQVAEWRTHPIFDPKNREKLSLAIEEQKSHVMEVRICAEDPAKWFSWVSMAKIKSWHLGLPRNLKRLVHFESFLSHEIGVNHTSKYDSMIGQLIVSGATREEARKNTIEALRSLKIEWIPTNQEFALRILESDEFRDHALRIDSLDSRPAKFFDNLAPFTEKIESISELREDSVVLEEGEYVIRMNQDAKITLVPTVWTQFSTTGSEWLFEITMNKVNTVITPKEIFGDNFYIKDSSGLISGLVEWKYEVMERMTIDPKNYSRGKAMLVIRPVV